jgi:hypothetical protein
MNRQTPDPGKVPVRQDGCALLQQGREFFLRGPQGPGTLSINNTAALIWGLCDGVRTLGEIQGMLGQAYPEAAASIPGEAQAILEKLHLEGLIRWRQVISSSTEAPRPDSFP